MRSLLSFFGDREIESLSFPDIRDWKLNLDKTRSAETVRNYVIKLRVVLTYCEKTGIKVLNPNLIPVPKRTDKVPAFISHDDVTKLIDSCFRLRAKTIISLLYASGVRVSELCNLDSSQIHDNTFTIVGKGGKARLCFFDERTKAYLDQYLAARKDNSPALFVSSQRPVRMTPTNIQLIIKSAAKRAGITTHVTPHTLRHSFATNLLRNNANIRYVQTMLGHSSLETTQMYTHVVDEDLRKIYREHHSI